MLGQRLQRWRRWPTIKTTLGQRFARVRPTCVLIFSSFKFYRHRVVKIATMELKRWFQCHYSQSLECYSTRWTSTQYQYTRDTSQSLVNSGIFSDSQGKKNKPAREVSYVVVVLKDTSEQTPDIWPIWFTARPKSATLARHWTHIGFSISCWMMTVFQVVDEM